MDCPNKVQILKKYKSTKYSYSWHGSSYGLSDQITKYKKYIKNIKNKSTKIPKYKFTEKNINSTKIQKIPRCQLWVQKKQRRAKHKKSKK